MKIFLNNKNLSLSEQAYKKLRPNKIKSITINLPITLLICSSLNHNISWIYSLINLTVYDAITHKNNYETRIP